MQQYKQLLIIGIGLLGTSVALAAKQANICTKIVGVDTNKDHLKKASTKNAITESYSDLSQCNSQDSIIIVAAPPHAVREIFSALNNLSLKGSIIIDVSSVKSAIIQEAKDQLGSAITQFVACHPLAGSESSGPNAANASLFHNNTVVITPHENNDPAIISQVTQFWQSFGASVSIIDAATHDHILAITSHLPQLTAFALAHSMISELEGPLLLKGKGYDDMTRLAKSAPTIWVDICLDNAEAITKGLERLIKQLTEMKSGIINHDAETLLRLFKDANQAKLTLDKSAIKD